MPVNEFINSKSGQSKKKAAKIRNQYNQVPYLSQDTTWESDKNTIKHHKQETRGPYNVSIRCSLKFGQIAITLCMLGNFSCFCCGLLFPQKNFVKNLFRNTIRV